MKSKLAPSAQQINLWQVGNLQFITYFQHPFYAGQVWFNKELVFETYGKPHDYESEVIDKLELWAQENEPKLQVYVFNFDGLWMGGAKVVLAYSKEEAVELAELNGVDFELKVMPIKSSVIYSDNGDY